MTVELVKTSEDEGRLYLLLNNGKYNNNHIAY